MTRWIDPQPIDVPPALHQVVGGHPLVAETLVRRGIQTPEAARAFLDPAAYTPASPLDLPGMERAVERLRRAIAGGEPLAVWGDFDADGQTSTALLVESLRVLGTDVRYYVPTRREGHGLHRLGVQRLVSGGARLIVTCDTGVTAHAAIEHAIQLGAEVIVTDHHVPGKSLPPAVATVNPRLLPADHPLADLTGVGAAYALIQGLNPTVAARCLDLVALGTVADVGALRADNRWLVQRGLEALRTTGRAGLQAVYEAADLRPDGLTEEHIGFVLGPRLNALGRLANASDGVELLLTEDETRARTLASEVEGLNARRQLLTKQVSDAAVAQIERDPTLLGDYAALVLSHPTWPGGVVGIVAGRLAERFGKPAVLIAAPAGEPARGSGRSVPGVDLIAALTECAPLLETFGGHPGAAGFSIEAERIPELRRALSRAVEAQVPALPERLLAIDAYVELPDLSLELVDQIGRLAPFGRGNPPLVLAVPDLHLLSEATIGRMAEHRRLTVEDAQDRSQTVFWWQGSDWPLPQGRFDLALTVRSSDYRGLAELQVEWIDARPREPAAVEVVPAPHIEVRDYRAVSNAAAVLRGLAAGEGVQIWAEGDGPPGVESRTRRQLAAGQRLVLWTLPPGPREFRAALETVQPDELVVLGHDAGLDEAGPFLERLAGMVRYALQSRQGQVDLEAAAAALGQRRATVQEGLEWLVAGGQVRLVERGQATWHLARGTGQADTAAVQTARLRLDALLAETAAYRAYLRTAPAPTLGTLVPQPAGL